MCQQMLDNWNILLVARMEPTREEVLRPTQGFRLMLSRDHRHEPVGRPMLV